MQKQQTMSIDWIHPLYEGCSVYNVKSHLSGLNPSVSSPRLLTLTVKVRPQVAIARFTWSGVHDQLRGTRAGRPNSKQYVCCVPTRVHPDMLNTPVLPAILWARHMCMFAGL